MEINDLLLLLVLQTFVLLVIIWFMRYSNRKLIHGIVELEKELKQFNEFLNRLSENQKKLRHRMEAVQSSGASASDVDGEPEKGTKKEEAEMVVHSKNPKK